MELLLRRRASEAMPKGPSVLVKRVLENFLRAADEAVPSSALAGDLKTAEPSTPRPTEKTLIITYIDKPESIEMLKKLYACNSLSIATELAAPIMTRYLRYGKGLYPVAAARAIAQLDGGFDDATDILMLVMFKASAGLHGNATAEWQSLRKGKGASSRIFKTVDAALALILLKHWILVVRRGAEIDWNPLPFTDSITAFWNGLLVSTPPPNALPRGSKHAMPHVLQPGKPQIMKACREILRAVHLRRIAVMKVNKVAGHVFPQELVTMIADQLVDSHFLLEVSAKLARIRAGGQTPVALPPCNSEGVWCVGLQKSGGPGCAFKAVLQASGR